MSPAAAAVGALSCLLVRTAVQPSSGKSQSKRRGKEEGSSSRKRGREETRKRKALRGHSPGGQSGGPLGLHQDGKKGGGEEAVGCPAPVPSPPGIPTHPQPTGTPTQATDVTRQTAGAHSLSKAELSRGVPEGAPPDRRTSWPPYQLHRGTTRRRRGPLLVLLLFLELVPATPTSLFCAPVSRPFHLQPCRTTRRRPSTWWPRQRRSWDPQSPSSGGSLGEEGTHSLGFSVESRKLES